MYRIEVASGEEAVFRTVEELATGIRNGLITPRSRIYHAASQKWLPIEFHPHYKKALQSVTGGAPMIDVSPPEPPRPPRPTPAPAPERRMTPSPPQSYVPAAPPPPPPAPAPVEPPVAAVTLPRISYPEVAPPKPADTPVLAPRRQAPGRGPLLIAVAAAIVLAGGYAMTQSGASEVAASPPAATPAAVQPAAAPDPVEAEEEDAMPMDHSEYPPPVTVTLPPPSSPSDPRSQAWSSSAGAIAPPPARVTSATPAAPVPDAPQLAPPPAAVELSVPSLPVADSFAPTAPPRDSAALNRILRAVSGRSTSGTGTR